MIKPAKLSTLRGAISFELIVAGVSITTGITSDVAGVIDFDIGLEVVPSGTHTAKLIVIDSDHPNGQVIFDANSRGVVKIKFV